MRREETSSAFALGSKLPKFSLKGTDEKIYTDKYLREGDAALVVFSCNHCPYVKGAEGMLIEVVRAFQGQGLRAVAINSNDAVQYPEDGFDAMKAKAASLSLPYPYLYDETQDVARSFDAACTPEVYLFDGAGSLIFHGAINDSPKDPKKANHNYLKTALGQLFKGEQVSPSFIHPLGCSIKWR